MFEWLLFYDEQDCLAKGLVHIDFYFLPFWNFVFNIADCGVVIGAIALVIYLVIEEVKDYRAKNKSENPSFNNNNEQK